MQRADVSCIEVVVLKCQGSPAESPAATPIPNFKTLQPHAKSENPRSGKMPMRNIAVASGFSGILGLDGASDSHHASSLTHPPLGLDGAADAWGDSMPGGWENTPPKDSWANTGETNAWDNAGPGPPNWEQSTASRAKQKTNELGDSRKTNSKSGE